MNATRLLFVLVLALAAWLTPSGGMAHASPAVDRHTPRQAVAGFLRAVEAGDGEAAAAYLQFEGLSVARRRRPGVALQFGSVLETQAWISVSNLSDLPDGDPNDGEEVERVTTVAAGGEGIPITLVRVKSDDANIWLFSAATVARLPELLRAQESPSWTSRFVPDTWHDKRLVGLWPWQWFGLLLAVAVGLPLGYLAGRITTWLLGRVARQTKIDWARAVVRSTRAGVRFASAWAAMGAVAWSLDLPIAVARAVGFAAKTPLILATGWILRQAVHALTQSYLDLTEDDVARDRRGLRTQLAILRSLSTAAIVLITFGLVMMQFEIVRSVGLSLLASAGVAGVALGFAAQKSLGDIIDGLQLSITQPIRLGDTVVVGGEWGRVEEIRLTFVRIALWDERRLVVPIGKFLHETFENWTAHGTELQGVVEIPVDPTAPMEKIRIEVARLAAEHESHDGRVCVVQLTEINEHRALLRARISSSDGLVVFQMRCDIREALIEYLRGLEGGRYLARTRWQNVPAVS